MKRELIFEKRKKARELHAKGWSIRKIASSLVAGKDSVSKWIKLEESKVKEDNRGWQRGNLRKHSEIEVDRIIKIRQELEAEDSYFIGPKVIQKNYINRYQHQIPIWLIIKVLKENRLSKSPQKKGGKKSRYMQYPEETLRKFGKTVMSADFIGPKYITGSDERINFLSCKYLRPVQYGIVKQVKGQTAEEALNVLKQIWQTYPLPQVVKLDNDSAFGATLSHQECIGKVSIALLNLGIIPLYVAPRSPWNNGSVEGFNSIFSRKFWNRLKFNNEEELSIAIRKFNLEYEKYTHLIANNASVESPVYLTGKETEEEFANRNVKNIKEDRIIFLRIIRRKGDKQGENEKGYIQVLGREIELPKSHINLFTFCELQIRNKKLLISIEGENGQLDQIKIVKFKVKNLEYDE